MQQFYQNKWTNAEMSADKVKAVIKIEGYIGIPRSWYYDESMREDIVATKEEMAKELKNLKNLKVSEIDVHINSYGGDVNHGISMYEALIGSGAVINVKIFGFTASIATVIAMAAPLERRIASANAFGLVHEGRGGQYGVSSAIRQYADFLDKVNDQIADIYAKSTKLSKDEAKELMARANGEGEWLTAAEMKDIGLISDTFEPLEAAASYVAEINNCGFLHQIPVPVNLPTSTPQLTTAEVIEQTAARMFDGFKNLISNNSKPKSNMNKQSLALAALCAVLAVEKIEITDEGSFLNQDQLTAIDAAMAKATADLKVSQDAAATAAADHKKVLDALNSFDPKVAAATTVEAKIEAAKVKMASKPGANPTGNNGGDGNKNPSNDGVDWDTINNLPHNKAADETIL